MTNTPTLLAPRKHNSVGLIPASRRFEQNYLLTRINLPSLEITRSVRDQILQAMAAGKNHVQLGEHTVMLNSIAAIEPMELERPPVKLLPADDYPRQPKSTKELLETRKMLPEWLRRRLDNNHPLEKGAPHA